MSQKTNFNIDVKSIDRIVCIMGFTCSASCLLSSSMDGHPNVLSFPDNVLSSFQDFWEEHSSLAFDPLLVAFLDKYATIFDARKSPKGYKGVAETGQSRGFTSLGPDRNEFLEVDKIVFHNYMKKFVGDIHPVPRKLFFQAIHLAYSKALGRKVIDPIIVFGLHNLSHPSRLKALMEDFSDVYFLQMVRHPLRATGARLKMQLDNGVGISHFHRIITGVSTGGIIDSSTSDDRWRAVRMEDLHHSPKENLEKICNWIGLPWDDSLLNSTINGKQWWNEKNGLQLSGFNTAFAQESFSAYLSDFDSLRMDIVLSLKYAAWNYPLSWWKKNFISKLLVLPLLLFPLKFELMAWSLIMDDIRRNKKPLAMKFWLSLRTLIGGFGLGRLSLFSAWLRTFNHHNREVHLR